MQRHFRILDVGLTLSGPAEALGPIAFAYRRFSVPDAPEASARFEVLGTGLEIDGRRVKFVPGLDRTFQIYQQFLNSLIDRVQSHALLHAACLRDRSGGGLILAAPSGHGKTSLTLELAHRGLGFMGDDYAPLALERAEVHPYPRAVAIILEGGATIPQCFRTLAAEPAAVRLFDKSLVDVGEALGEDSLAPGPVPLRRAVFLSPGLARPGGGSTWLVVGARSSEADALHRIFARTEGVEVVARADRDSMSVWRLRLDHDRNPTAALVGTLDSDRVLFSEKQWEQLPEFRGTPEAKTISRLEAAEMLGRELLNRRQGGRLLARYGGSLAALFTDLAGALAGVDCRRVRVGEFGATADLVERLAGGTS